MACATRDDALRRWTQACHDEGLALPPDDIKLQQYKIAIDDVLCDHDLLARADPDAVLWRLSCLVDDAESIDLASGIGAWALAMWMMDELYYSRFPTSRSSSFSAALVQFDSLCSSLLLGI